MRLPASRVGAPPFGIMPCARTLICAFAVSGTFGNSLASGKLNGLPDFSCAPLGEDDASPAAAVATADADAEK